jgi:DNA-damage-inducible protein J
MISFDIQLKGLIRRWKMTKTANLFLRLDPELKNDTESIFAQYGLKLSEAITIFLHQARNAGGLPFDLRPPQFNDLTLKAMVEGEKILAAGQARFKTSSDLLKALKS